MLKIMDKLLNKALQRKANARVLRSSGFSASLRGILCLGRDCTKSRNFYHGLTLHGVVKRPIKGCGPAIA